MVNGNTQYYPVSRFIKEIPEEYLETDDGKRDKPSESYDMEDADLPWNAESRRGRVSSFAPGTDSYRSPYASDSSSREGIFDRGRDGSFPSNRKSAAASYGRNPGFGKTFSVTKAEKLDYQEGDRVRHKLFGDGVVNSIVDRKKDYEVTVCFDKAGVKKMFANFAKLEKIESSEI